MPWPHPTSLVRELPGAVTHLAFRVDGQRDPRTRPVVWVPGGGSHGGGGSQAPPLVPSAPEWDLDRRIR